MTELLLALAHFSLLFFPIKQSFECIDLPLVLIQRVSDRLDLPSLVLDRVSMLTNATFKVLPIGTGFELNESLLLVDCLALLLDSLLELLTCGICVSTVIGIVLLTVGLGSWFFSLLCSVLIGSTLC